MSGKVIIYGGKGGLGTVLVSYFKNKGWNIVSIDLKANEDADSNVIVDPNDDWTTQESKVLEQVAKSLGDNKVDAIINMAGNYTNIKILSYL